MNKILTIQQAIEVSQKLKNQNKKIVLAGGVFDILHSGHIAFLLHAKKQGDFLFVFLESDEKVKLAKGEKRPINIQQKRAAILSSLPSVDYVILLPFLKENKEYDDLVAKIKPDIIATTKDDKNIQHKKRQAEAIGAKVVEVIELIPNLSTTLLEKQIT